MYRTIIVEDDPMVASINTSYLGKMSQFQLDRQFSNGREALSYLENHDIDLAIVDYYMPEMDGLAFIRACRARGYKISIIMITAANKMQDFTEFMSLGVLDYIIKPFTQERFLQALNHFMDYSSQTSEVERTLSQEEIDAMASGTQEEGQAPLDTVKGIQPQTLDNIMKCLKEHRGTYLTNNEIAAMLDLSRITVRRYMNHLVDMHKVVSRMDYTTGGRPSIQYTLK